MAHNYCVTAQPPTAVTHSLVSSFTGPEVLNLIVSRCTRVQIYALEPQGLKLLHDVPLYGRVANMELWRPAGKTTDRLFISTERYQFCILSYDAAKGDIVTEAMGDVSDRIGRPADAGQIAVIEPQSRMIGLHLYDGLFKVMPATTSGSLAQEAFNIRLEELQVIDMVFLHGPPKPTLAVLYQDAKEARHLKTYEVLLREKDFGDGPWAVTSVEAGASILIAVKSGGVLILGEQSITYHSGSDFKSIAIPFACFKAYERIDETRYLLADHQGNLHVLLLDCAAPDGPIRGLCLESMGVTSIASAISYLSDGIAFIGSAQGDSQLVSLLTEPDESGTYIQEIQRWSNLGPIVDFVVVDLERHGQGQLVTCSGASKDGSLRIVRNGIGINEDARIELPGIKGLWSARVAGKTYLVLSFISETRVLLTQDDELGEVEPEGFDGDSATVCCAPLGDTAIVQVTAGGVRLIDGVGLTLLDMWQPDSAISMAAVDGSRVLLASSGQQLHLLEAVGGKWRAVTTVTTAHEVACLALGSSGFSGSSDAMVDDEAPPLGSSLAAVGLWTDLSIRLLDARTLKEVHNEPLGGAVIPRSLVIAPFADKLYLLCALGDGQLITYSLDERASAAAAGRSCGLNDRKVVTLGTKPITLTPFRSHGTFHVFASSDRPTIVHEASGKLLYSNINLKDATYMATFDADGASPDTLAIASEDALLVGTVDEIRKLHIRTFPLKEQPRRISHLEHAHVFAVLTVRTEVASDGEETETAFVRLHDETTLERIASFQLQATESPCSILTLHQPKDSAAPNALLVVGTAYARPDEPEPCSGRLLVFDVAERSLELLAETRIKGACYSLEAYGDSSLLAGVNNKMQLYEWHAATTGSSPSLRLRCEHCGHILVLYIAVRGDFILVGDLMKSLSLLQCQGGGSALVELARDSSANWMTSVAFLDDDTYLGAENSLNLFVARKNADAATDDERGRLEIIGEYHLGEFVNKFRKGSLAMQVTESGAAPIPTLLYCTVNGVLGVIATLPQEDYAFLLKVQSALTTVIQGVGGLSHSAWRSFRNERKTVEATNVVDGDLIESFLELQPSEMEQVVSGLGVTVDELSKRIQDLARLH